ncbi:MAG: penicillin-insensitive murein endopeptidase [Labilithrix sp.]|nr:penicillin-insensitive murein endopeptidase [Labilithrix sp.]
MPLLRHHRILVALLFVLPAAAADAAPSPKSPSKKPPTASQHKTVLTKVVAPRARDAAPQALPFGKSIGSPTDGHLVGGARLADGPHLRMYPAYARGDVRWGLGPLVGLIDRSAQSVRKQFPDAVLSVGHLSKAGGGELDRHASHESGRDADIGFYVKNHLGKPIYSDHMVPFVGDGTAPTWPGARFDDARNWALVASLVSDGRARVTHIFVATPIRQRLLAYAEKVGWSPAIRSRAAEVLAQPRGSLPHDDHFHVRIACPSGMEKCIEQPMARNRARTRPPAQQGHDGRREAHAHAAPAKPAPKPEPAPAKPAPKPAPKVEEDKSEALIPSLAPSVPGLDSAVIPAPLAGVRSTWGTSKDPPPPPPKSDPISDPDGVLDGR